MVTIENFKTEAIFLEGNCTKLYKEYFEISTVSALDQIFAKPYYIGKEVSDDDIEKYNSGFWVKKVDYYKFLKIFETVNFVGEYSSIIVLVLALKRYLFCLKMPSEIYSLKKDALSLVEFINSENLEKMKGGRINLFSKYQKPILQLDYEVLEIIRLSLDCFLNTENGKEYIQDLQYQNQMWNKIKNTHMAIRGANIRSTRSLHKNRFIKLINSHLSIEKIDTTNRSYIIGELLEEIFGPSPRFKIEDPSIEEKKDFHYNSLRKLL